MYSIDGMSISIQWNDFDNTLMPHDFVWTLAGSDDVADCSALYYRCGPVLAIMMQGIQHGKLERSGHLTDDHIFAFVRNLAHRCIITLHKDDCFQRLFKLYEFCHCYDLHQRVCQTVMGALCSKLEPGLVLLAIQESKSEELTTYLQSYLISHPIDCLNTRNIYKIDVDIIKHVIEIFKTKGFNCSNESIMTALQNIIQKKRMIASDYIDCINTKRLSFDYLMQFRKSNPETFSDSFYMNIFTQLESETHSNSCNFYMDSKIPYLNNLVTMHVQALECTIATVIGEPLENTQTNIPPFTTCFGILHMCMITSNTHVGFRGHVNRGIHDPENDCTVNHKQIEIRIIHQEKNNKKSITINDIDREFGHDKFIALNTLNNAYYHRFPFTGTASYIVLRVTCRKNI